MSENEREVFLDLLVKKAVYGLDANEQQELEAIDADTADAELPSLEMTAAAISLIGLSADEAMPAHLKNKIVDDAEEFFATTRLAEAEAEPWPPAPKAEYLQPERRTPWFAWLGWVVAAAIAIAFGLNTYIERSHQQEVARNEQPSSAPAPAPQTAEEAREALIRSTPDIVEAKWSPGNVKDLKQISGDVVWSDQKQAGYMRFHGLPPNDPSRSTYQLWIFDRSQDKATPIDGGTFDVNANGDVIIPVDAALHADRPSMFAVTVEKPGGVVVSKREKIAAIAQVETKAS